MNFEKESEKIKYTVETTGNGVNETLELYGIIYKKEWIRREDGIFECLQKNFLEQMEQEGNNETN